MTLHQESPGLQASPIVTTATMLKATPLSFVMRMLYSNVLNFLQLNCKSCCCHATLESIIQLHVFLGTNKPSTKAMTMANTSHEVGGQERGVPGALRSRILEMLAEIWQFGSAPRSIDRENHTTSVTGVTTLHEHDSCSYVSFAYAFANGAL